MTRYETTVRAAQEGAEIAHERFRTELDVGTKASRMDFVTEADVETQRHVASLVRDEYPDATVVGEEGDERKAVPDDGDAWIVDPIDGTSNFVRETQLWTTTVASVESGDPVAAATVAPALGDVYAANPDTVTRNGRSISVSSHADLDAFTVAPILRYGSERDDEFGDLLRGLMRDFGDVRRLGCAQATLAMVACGSLDAAVSPQPKPNPWDTVAGVYLVERAGGTVTDIHGSPWHPDAEGLIASNGAAHDDVLDRVVRAIRPE